MKKFVSFIILTLCAVLTANANVTDNTYVGVTIGADSQIHPWEFNGMNAGLKVGKMFTPFLGGEIIGQARFTNFYRTITSHRVGVNVLGNINELFFNGKRDVVEFVPYVGIGWQRNYDVIANNFYTAMGVNVNFNVSDRVFLTIAPQIAYVLNTHSGLKYNVNYADLGISVGAAYRFGDYFKICDKKYTQAEWDTLNNCINKLREENKLLANRKPEVKTIVKEITSTILPNVGFECGSTDISNTNLLNIKTIANWMKNTNDNYTIYGYASIEGPEMLNNNLAQERANAIRNVLINEGVAADRLTAIGKGSTSQFGDTYELNRTVVIK